MSQLKGGGGKKQTAATPTNTPDNLRSEDTVEIVLGVTEGPWRGLTNGNKSVNVGDTVLQRQDGEYNFQDFDVKVYPGNAFPDPLTFKLGGESSNFQVGVATSYGIPLTRQTEHGNIDAIDIRMVVQQLYTSQETGKNPGVFDATFEFKIRYKPASATEWSEWDGAAAQQPGTGNPYVTPYQTWSEDVQYFVDHYFDPATHQTWYPSSFNSATNWYVANGGSYGGILRITGKTTSTYVKEYRIPVQRIPEPYMIQIVRMSQDSSLTGDPKYYAEVTWESFQTIDTSPKTYPYTGFLQISGRSTDQFTSIPQFSGEGDGLILKVPTNYDPDTHTYTGIWDGNFKEAWTNDPVWILYEAIHNDRWGWSTYTPVKWSRYEAYELSQITNFKLANGEPRYTFNAYLTEAMDGREFCRYIAGSFNSVIVDDDNGNVRVLMDKDDPAVAIFGPESIVGDFEYTYTDTNTRFNDITAVFRNPTIDYNEDRRGIKDDAHIAQFGRIPFDFVSVGTTNENEAIRKASRRLVSATTETEMVNFKTNRKAQYLTPYDVILITDPYKGYGISGRFKSFSGTTAQLRDPIYLETGVTYAIDFEDPSGIITRTLTGVTTGFTTTLTLSSAIPGTVNQKAQFSLKQDGAGYGLPKPYRILDIGRNGEDDYSVMAIEINRNKFAAEDNAELVGEPRYSFPIKKEPAGPTNLKVTNLSRAAEDGTMIYEVRYDFTPPSDPYVTDHYIRYRLDDESEYTVSITEGTGGIVTLPRAGSWVFEAQSRNIWSQQSPWAAATPTPLVVNKAGGVQQGGSILSATGGLNQITIKVAYPTDQTDIRYVNVYAALSNSNGAATFVGKTDSDTYTISGLSGVQSRYVFIKFEDNLGNLGPFTSSTGALATTTTAGSNDLANGSVTAQKFAPGISPVESVSSLPLTGNFEGRMVLLSTDGKLYSYTGGQWKTVVADTSGSGIAPVNTLPTGLTTADEGRVVYLKSDKKLYRWDGTQWIANYSAADIDGQIVASQIASASIDRTKFATGITPTEILSVLPTTGNFSGRMVYLTTDGKLYRHNGTSFVSSTAATDISGTLAATQIPGLDANKITSGQFTNAYIAAGAIDATKFASGLRPVEIVSTLPTTGNTQGRTVFNTSDNKQYRWLSSSVSTGTQYWSATSSASDITGELASSQIATGAITSTKILDGSITTPKMVVGSIDANRLVAQSITAGLIAANSITAAQIAADTITAGQIAAGAITSSEIAAKSVTANKLLVVPTNMFPDPFFRETSVPSALWTVSPGWYYEGRNAGNVFDQQGFPSGMVLWADHPSVGGTIHDTRYVYISDGSRLQGVEPGRTYRVRANVYNNLNAYLFVSIDFFNSLTGLSVGGGFASGNSAAPNSLNGVIDYQAVAPEGADQYRILAYNATVPTLTGLATVTNIQVALAASASMIVDGAIVADKIAANAITAGKILAGSITASKLTVTDTSNIYPDPDFIDINAFQASWNGGITFATQSWNVGSKNWIFMNGSGVEVDANSKIMAATPGAPYYISVAALPATDASVYFYVEWLSRNDSDGNYSNITHTYIGGRVANAGIGRITGTMTAPAGTKGMRLLFRRNAGGSNPAYFAEPIVRRATNAELIVDGSITANKLVANSITAGQIAAGAIGADQIAANAIIAKHLTIGNFDNIIPDSGYMEPAFWDNGAGRVTVTDFDGNWSQPRGLVIAQAGGSFDTVSRYFPVEPGAVYKVTYRLSTGGMVNGGWFQPLIHVPNYQWQSILRSGPAGVNTGADFVGFTGTNDGSVYGAGADTLEQSYTFYNPAGVGANANRQIQFRFLGNFSGYIVMQIQIVRVSDNTLIADGAITTNKITARSITAGKIAVDTITANEIAVGAITASEIASKTITAGQIAGGTITGDLVAANTITAGKMSVTDLAAINANLGTVTAGYIQAWTGVSFFDLNNSRLQLGNPSNTTYVQRFGFIGSNLSTWYGPNSVAIGSETIANSKWAQSAVDGKIYIGGNELTLPASEVGFVLAGTASPTLLGFNVISTTAFVSLTGPSPVGSVTYRWERMGGLAATLSNTESSGVGVNIGTPQDGVVQLRVSVSDDERTKSREIRLRFRTNS